MHSAIRMPRIFWGCDMNLLKLLIGLLNRKLAYKDLVVTNHGKNSVSVNNYTTGTILAENAGYYPLGIVGHYSSSSYTGCAQAYLSNKAAGSATINYDLNNTSSSSRTTNISYDVLWAKIGGALRNIKNMLISERRWAFC